MANVWDVERPIRSLVFRSVAWVGVASLLLLGGCKKQPSNIEAPKAGPAPSAAPAAQEQSQAPAPAPAPPPPSPPGVSSEAAPSSTPSASAAAPAAPVVSVIPRNTRVTVRLSQTLGAKHNAVGDSFRGTLAESLRVNGAIVVRYGTPVSGTVVGAKGQGKLAGAGDLAITLARIGSNSVTTSVYEQSVPGKGKRTAGFIGGGGGGGALLGGLAGGGKGALIGGLLGAGAGTAGAAFTGGKQVAIPAEALVSFRLTSPLRVVVTPPAAKAAQ